METIKRGNYLGPRGLWVHLKLRVVVDLEVALEACAVNRPMFSFSLRFGFRGLGF